MACSENQEAYYQRVYEKEVHEGDDVFNATWVDVNIRADDACKVYLSCEKSPLMQSLESTKNLVGYYKFFGEGSLSQKDEDEPDNKSCGLNRPDRVHLLPQQGHHPHRPRPHPPVLDRLHHQQGRVRLRGRAQRGVRLFRLRPELSAD